MSRRQSRKKPERGLAHSDREVVDWLKAHRQGTGLGWDKAVKLLKDIYVFENPKIYEDMLEGLSKRGSTPHSVYFLIRRTRASKYLEF